MTTKSINLFFCGLLIERARKKQCIDPMVLASNRYQYQSLYGYYWYLDRSARLYVTVKMVALEIFKKETEQVQFLCN